MNVTQKYFDYMNFFSKKNEHPEETPGVITFKSIAYSSKILFDEQPANDPGVFEVILFSYMVIIRIYKQKNAKNFSKFNDEFIQSLLLFASDYGIRPKNDYLIEFIKKRMAFYDEQIDLLISKDELYIPLKLIHLFYEEPLTDKILDSKDVPLALLTISKIKYLFEAHNQVISLIIKEYKL